MATARRNPPLSEHMEEDSYDELYRHLVRRVMREPEDAIEFAYSILDTAHMGLLRYERKSVEQDEKSELGQASRHLDEALLHIEKALRALDD